MKKIPKNSKITTITLVLLLTLSAIIIAFPSVSSQEYDFRKTTFAIIGATPNPIGVNQETLLHVGITDFLRDVDEGWEGLTITVTRPDGQTETLGPFKTDSTGGTGTIYTPTMVGTYKLRTNFPEQTYFWTPNNRVPFEGLILYEASESEELELVVNQDPRAEYPLIPQPDEYWTRPIDAQFREWSTVAGNWLEGSGRGGIVTPANSEAPDTAHVLWSTPLEAGGLVGDILDDHAMEDGDAYWGKFTDSVVVAGIFCYNEYSVGFTAPIGVHKVTAMDLRTGEKLWSKVLGDNERISFAQLLLWDTFNYHGVFPYIWTTPGGGVYKAYDPFTGEWDHTLENVPGGTRTYGSKGEILIYNVNTRNGYMTLWNSSNIPALYNGQTDPSDPNYGEPGYGGFGWGSWYARGKTVDATGPVTVYPNQPLGLAGYSWNVSIPTGLSGSTVVIVEKKVIGVSVTRTEVSSWALSLEPGKEGTLLFQNTWQAPAEWETGTLDVSLAAPVTTAAFEADSFLDSDVFVVWAKELRKYYGFSASTGAFLWETPSQPYLDIYVGTNRAIGYGKFFTCGYGGVLNCYDTQTGLLDWSYDAVDPKNEILWGNNWPLRIQYITDGKIYVGMEEHSSVDPKPRGAPFFAVDIETGDLVWRIDGGFRQNHWGGQSIIGDSVIATMDSYSQLIFAIGKGPSSLTLETPLLAISKGSGVNIKGRVTDVSPGTKDYTLTSRFPNGVPAVADQYMSDWMLYVYKQFPRPSDAVGVPVKIQIVDPEGVYAWIGTATSDAYGNYAYPFAPQKEGQYTIIATFDGSDSYYGAQATDYLLVGPASTPTSPITPETPASPLVTTEVALVLVAAIAAIVIVAFLALRKRK